MSSHSSSPPNKRARLDSVSPKSDNPDEEHEEVTDDLSQDHCTICLQEIVDRTMIPVCSHEFCFDCLLIWTKQSRRCPLCSQNMGDHVIHNYRSRYDYQKHFLPPLRTSPKPLLPLANRAGRSQQHRPRIPREIRERSRREREERDEADRFDRALARRRWIYRHNLYAKHIASNTYTRFKAYPTPAQFAASSDLISRTTSFLRRELLVWPDLDVEFLTTFTISLMKAIDIRSESAVKLLAEFLDMDAPYVQGGRHVNAEHFAHEVYSYVRSPYRDLFVYDSVVQYGTPSAEVSPPRSRVRSSSPHQGHAERRLSRSHSRSWSPSGRSYPSSRSRAQEMGGYDGSPSHSLQFRNPSPPPLRPRLSRAPTPNGSPTRRRRDSSGSRDRLVYGRNRSHSRSKSLSSPQQLERNELKPDERKTSASTDIPVSSPDQGGSEPNHSSKGKRKADTLGERNSGQGPITYSKRPSRLLDIQTSVQAHLSQTALARDRLSSRNEAQRGHSNSQLTIAAPLRIKGQANLLSSSESPPSLLSRLSDTRIDENNNPVSTGSMLSNHHSRHSSEPGDDDSEPYRNQDSGSRLPSSSISASALSRGLHDTSEHNREISKEIRNLTPVRGEKDLETDSEQVSSLTASNGFEKLTGPTHTPHVEPSEGRMNAGELNAYSRLSSSKVQGSHTSESTFNTRLLHKLEGEKRLLENQSATLVEPSASSAPVVGRNSMPFSVSIDTQAMEAKLRARTLLRMRLESEKRISAARENTS